MYEFNVAMNSQQQIQARYVAEAGVEHLFYEIRQLVQEKNILDPVRTSDMLVNGVTGNLEWTSDKMTYLTQVQLNALRTNWNISPPGLNGGRYRITSLELRDKNDAPIVSAVTPFPTLTHTFRIQTTVVAENVGTYGKGYTKEISASFVVELTHEGSGNWRMGVARVKDL